MVPTSIPMPFIVGVPRSGTTLLGMMLDAHPDIVISPKTRFIPRIASVCQESSAPHDTFFQMITSTAVNHCWSDWHIASDDLKQAINAIQPFDLATALRTLYRLLSQRDGKSRYGDRTPGNLASMESIQQILPEAHFIHIVRDGRGQWLSERKTAWGTQSAWRSALRWATQVERARRATGRIPHYLEVRYMDLVISPSAILQRICMFIKLPWDDHMLNYSENAARRLAERQDTIAFSAEYRSHIHINVLKAPDITRINAWREELTPVEIYQFELLAGDVLLASGCELNFNVKPVLCKLRRRFASIMAHGLRWWGYV